MKLASFAAAVAAVIASAPAFAQDARSYPTKAIRFIVASQPGGLADMTPCLLSPKLQEVLG